MWSVACIFDGELSAMTHLLGEWERTVDGFEREQPTFLFLVVFCV
jgi:hypothetical protein